MKISAVLLLVILPLLAFTQKSDSLKGSKLDFGFTFSPEYCNSILKSTDDRQFLINILDTLETSKYGYTIGTDISFKLTDKISFASGILFSNWGENVKTVDATALKGITNHYYYLNLPLKLNYYAWSRREKIKFFMSGGLSANLFLTHKVSTQYTNSSMKGNAAGNNNLSKLNFSANVGIGFDYIVSDNCYFKFETIYQQNFTPILNSPIKRFLFSIGPNIGFYFHF